MKVKDEKDDIGLMTKFKEFILEHEINHLDENDFINNSRPPSYRLSP